MWSRGERSLLGSGLNISKKLCIKATRNHGFVLSLIQGEEERLYTKILSETGNPAISVSRLIKIEKEVTYIKFLSKT